MKNKGKFFSNFISHNPMILVIIGFISIILAGTFLLMLPISNNNGEWLSPLSALFTATSATCVTGLTIGDTQTIFTFFGQFVILCMIQVGGLGFMSLAMILMMVMRKAISFSERIVLSSSLGLSSAGGILAFVRLVVGGTLIIEGTGALLLSFYFIPKYGFFSGLWKSVFHAISAFCNAGFDILGNGDSLASIRGNGYVLTILILLTIIGGLGFIVWKELINRKLSIYSKMVLVMSGTLLLFGTVFYLLAEWNNPSTIGNMSVGGKILNALFSSVTMRTVGFATFDFSLFNEPSKIISSLLMFIGGSSGSTAGGIKTVTFFVLLITALQVSCGRSKIQFRGRSIAQEDIYRSFSLFFIACAIVLTSTLSVGFLTPKAPLIDILFTCISAFATVGCAAYNIASMPALSKIILILLMFMGRLGILSITLAIMIRLNRNKDKISYPKANILIG
ncbi:MAG: Trk family potassium uptake protein [Clostridia bacterium]|nr:Trk family potassium uptake protein [Clostridia bacterium]